MVASAKVKKAEASVKASRPFTLELYKMFSWVYQESKDEQKNKINTQNAIENYPALLEKREVKNVGLVVVSANKGLAGSYSSNVVRYATKMIKEFKEQGKNVNIYFVGQKAVGPIKSLQNTVEFDIRKTYISILDNPDSNSAYAIAGDLADDYTNGIIDEIHLVTTRYKNMMSCKTESWKLLPAITTDELVSKFQSEKLDKELGITHKTQKIEPLSEYLPNINEVLSVIVPMFITNVVYQALLEAQASELSSRMTAMSAATNNADEMINTLTIEYNKARQTSITNEITEVISGANAV